MEMKICTKCNIEKDITLFVKRSKSSDGHAFECKECHNAYGKQKYIEDIDNNRIKANKHTHDYYLRHPGRHYGSFKRYKEKYPERRKETEKNYRLKNKDKIKAYKRRTAYKYIERKRTRSKEYRTENREKLNEKNRIIRNSSEQNKLKHNLRNRIRFVLKGLRRGGRLHELVGCSVDFLKSYLESQFTAGMSWGTYGTGGWHVDHVIPIKAFDLTNEIQQKACFYYKNLSPLWGSDNISKSAKYNIGDFNAYMEWFTENVINK
jgi:hypothetical protein